MDFDLFPAYNELCELLENMVLLNKDMAWAETIGLSEEGREVRVIHVSNKEIPIQNKEIVLIICGRHGDEIGTRVVSPFLLEWLFSAAAGEILRSQHIIIVPIANPDACEKEIFGAPRDSLSGLEEETLLKLGIKYIPDAVIDVHSVGKEKYGYNWGGLQAVVIDRDARDGEDQYILSAIAYEMIQKACGEGFHFLFHDIDFYRNLPVRGKTISTHAFNNHINGACYKAFHSLTFGVEVNHFLYSPNETGRSGTALIKSFLQMGNREFPWEFYQGYPNRLLSGDFLASIRTRGINAGERRKSRQEIWNNIDKFTDFFNPYREITDKHTLKVLCKYRGEEKIEGGITIGFCLMNRPEIKKVRLNGTPVSYDVKETPCSLNLFVDVEKIQKDWDSEIVAEF